MNVSERDVSFLPVFLKPRSWALSSHGPLVRRTWSKGPSLTRSGHGASMRSKCSKPLRLGDSMLRSMICLSHLIRLVWPVHLSAVLCRHAIVQGHFGTIQHTTDLRARCFSKQGKSVVVFMYNPFYSKQQSGWQHYAICQLKLFLSSQIKNCSNIQQGNDLIWVGFRQLFKNCFSFMRGS